MFFWEVALMERSWCNTKFSETGTNKLRIEWLISPSWIALDDKNSTSLQFQSFGIGCRQRNNLSISVIMYTNKKNPQLKKEGVLAFNTYINHIDSMILLDLRLTIGVG